MPNDYIKYVPHPSSSWPQAETTSLWGSPLQNHDSQVWNDSSRAVTQLPPPLASSRNHGVQTFQTNNENFDPLLMKLNQLQQEVNTMTAKTPMSEDRNSIQEDTFENTTDNSAFDKYNERNNTNEFETREMSPEFHLKDNFQILPWFDRFMEMADSIYKSDFNSSGALPESKIVDITEKYNAMLNLKLKREDISSALRASKRSHGSIDINNFLKLLAVKK